MRALRDMNMPKFVADDVILFLGLIDDLFPGVQIESSSHAGLRNIAISVYEERNLDPLPM